MSQENAAVIGESMPTGEPDIKVSVRQVFGIDSDMEVPAFSQTTDHVPDIDWQLETAAPAPYPSPSPSA